MFSAVFKISKSFLWLEILKFLWVSTTLVHRPILNMETERPICLPNHHLGAGAHHSFGLRGGSLELLFPPAWTWAAHNLLGTYNMHGLNNDFLWTKLYLQLSCWWLLGDVGYCQLCCQGGSAGLGKRYYFFENYEILLQPKRASTRRIG